MKKIKKAILGLIIISLTVSFNSGISAMAKETNNNVINVESNEKETDESKCPIIIVPGIMGTHLYADEEGRERVWEPSTDTVISSVFNKKLGSNLKYGNPLYVLHNYENQVTSINREYGALDTYKTLVDKLCDKFKDRQVYFFSYDFRDSNTKSSEKLNEMINKVKGDKWTKVDLVCHSMGGLVASDYVSKYGNNSIRKVVTFGTPYEGAPKLLNAVLNWDILTEDNNPFNSYTIADSFLGMAGITKSVKAGFPSIAELAPTKELFNKYNYYVRTRSGFLWLRKKDEKINYSKYSTICKNIFGNNFINATKFHNSIKNNGVNNLASLNNSYFVVGINQPTIASVVFNNVNSLNTLECSDLQYEYKGDGTVPYYSSTIIDKLDSIKDSKERVLKVDSTHTGILTSDETLKWMCDILSSKDNTVNTNVKSSVIKSTKYCVLRVESSADVNIDREGEELNSNIKSTEDVSSFGRLDIIGKDNKIKMVCLKDDEAYNVNLKGTDNDKINYAIRWYDENGNIVDERGFEDVDVTKNTRIITTTDETKPTELVVDKNNDGKTDEIYEANSNSIGSKVNSINNNVNKNESQISNNNVKPKATISNNKESNKEKLKNTSVKKLKSADNVNNYNRFNKTIIYCLIIGIVIITISIYGKKTVKRNK